MKSTVDNIKYMLERGFLRYEDLTRKQRKQLEQSKQVPEAVRRYQSQEDIDKNVYVEVPVDKPTHRPIKAECVNGEWWFSAKGYRHLIDEITSIYPVFGSKTLINGVVIVRSGLNEAVIYEPIE